MVVDTRLSESRDQGLERISPNIPFSQHMYPVLNITILNTVCTTKFCRSFFSSDLQNLVLHTVDIFHLLALRILNFSSLRLQCITKH